MGEEGSISTQPQQFLPLSEPVFYILVCLAPGKKHGYAILKDVEALSQGGLTLSTSTLYDALGRLLQQGLIERVEDEGPEINGRVRKSYVLSRLGRRVLLAETQRMKALLAVAVPRLLEPARAPRRAEKGSP